MNYYDAPAGFNHDRTHRYWLKRSWTNGKGWVNFILLNPSTADETLDDATIRRCIRYAMDWGHRGLYVTNLFSYRTSKPSILKAHVWNNGNPKENREVLMALSTWSSKIILGWGNELPHQDAKRFLLDYLSTDDCLWNKVHVLKLNQGGEPSHPLYLRSDLKPLRVDWDGRELTLTETKGAVDGTQRETQKNVT